MNYNGYNYIIYLIFSLIFVLLFSYYFNCITFFNFLFSYRYFWYLIAIMTISSSSSDPPVSFLFPHFLSSSHSLFLARLLRPGLSTWGCIFWSRLFVIAPVVYVARVSRRGAVKHKQLLHMHSMNTAASFKPIKPLASEASLISRSPQLDWEIPPLICCNLIKACIDLSDRLKGELVSRGASF